MDKNMDERSVEAEELANKLLEFVNNYSHDADTFAKTIAWTQDITTVRYAADEAYNRGNGESDAGRTQCRDGGIGEEDYRDYGRIFFAVGLSGDGCYERVYSQPYDRIRLV